MNPSEEKATLYTEEEIIRKVITGEKSCFELLVRRTNPYLYKVGRSYGFNHQDTEDLMQEAHVSAYLNLAKFQYRSAYKTWIVRIMINHCNQRLQKSSFRNERPEEKSVNERSNPMFMSKATTDTGRAILNKELSHVIEAAINQMPADYRTVFCLRELTGLNVAETAEALQISEGNVKVRLNRAKSMLKEQIEKMYRPDELFEFNLIYCDKLTSRVMARIEPLPVPSQK
jgi:RNA polymerase sigma factor (sigma-70 family)